MAYYLIDFENVKSRGMEGVELLTEEDTVCIFYSDNADSMRRRQTSFTTR